jgi:hypothetical protein
MSDANEIQFIYEVDASDLIVSLNDSWLKFAEDNNSSELNRNAVIGKSLWTFISNFSVQALWKDVLTRVRTTSNTYTFPFRCDSPDCRRYLETTVSPLQKDGIRFENRVIELQFRDAISIKDSKKEESSELILMCSYCKRIKAESEWLEIERAIDALQLFETDRSEISHGICDPCFKQVIDTMDSH